MDDRTPTANAVRPARAWVSLLVGNEQYLHATSGRLGRRLVFAAVFARSAAVTARRRRSAGGG